MNKNNTPKLKAVICNPAVFFAVAFLCIGAVTVYELLLARIGIGIIEQSFYLTVPHRFALGDRPLIDEWHVSQFSGIILYPLYKIVYSISGNEGVVLTFRYLYVALHSAVSVFVFLRLREYKYPGIIAAVTYALYTPIETFALSYNSMSLMACTVVFLLLFTGRRNKSGELFFAGIFAACAVLSEPLLAVIYFVWLIAVGIRTIRNKTNKSEIADKYSLLSVRSSLMLTAGVAVCAAAFFVFLCMRGGFTEYIRALPDFFTDSDHSFGRFSLLYDALLTVVGEIGWYFYAAEAILLVVIVFDKNRLIRRRAYIIIAFCLLVCETVFLYGRYYAQTRAFTESFVYTWMQQPYILRHIPFFVFGIVVFALLGNRHAACRLWLLYLSGWVYSACLALSTDAYEVVFLLGGVISDLAVMCLTYRLYSEIKNDRSRKDEQKRSPRRAICCVLCLACCIAPVCEFVSMSGRRDMLLSVDTNTAHIASGDDSIGYVTLDAGPLKAILTTEVIAERYGQMLSDLDVIRSECKGRVYVFGLFSWIYLYLDMPYGTYSAWFADRDFETRQVDYWRKYPEKLPEYIYVPKYEAYGFSPISETEIKESLSRLRKVFDCSITEYEAGYIARVKTLDPK
ncbi:MAG: hypothetical protein K6G90_01565 [Clostridia bacterium]|nr:hypothetical protein [Clostridia bacterium]